MFLLSFCFKIKLFRHTDECFFEIKSSPRINLEYILEAFTNCSRQMIVMVQLALSYRLIIVSYKIHEGIRVQSSLIKHARIRVQIRFSMPIFHTITVLLDIFNIKNHKNAISSSVISWTNLIELFLPICVPDLKLNYLVFYNNIEISFF